MIKVVVRDVIQQMYVRNVGKSHLTNRSSKKKLTINTPIMLSIILMRFFHTFISEQTSCRIICEGWSSI
jgi:hypothetical protein